MSLSQNEGTTAQWRRRICWAMSRHGKKKKKAVCDHSYVPSMIVLILQQKHPAILPGNVMKNTHIEALRHQWQCTKRKPTCIGSHCYINPETDEHTPLSHERFDCWASAMVLSTVAWFCDGTEWWHIDEGWRMCNTFQASKPCSFLFSTCATQPCSAAPSR